MDLETERLNVSEVKHRASVMKAAAPRVMAMPSSRSPTAGVRPEGIRSGISSRCSIAP